MRPWQIETGGRIVSYDEALVLRAEISPHWAGGYQLRIVNTMEDMTVELKQCKSIEEAKAAADDWIERNL